MSEGWKIDHDAHGQLVATHQHDAGLPVVAELRRNEDGFRYAACAECGGTFTIDRDKGDEVTIR